MKLPTKRKIKSFFRRLWNGKEVYAIAFVIIGGLWMVGRVVDGMEKQAARQEMPAPTQTYYGVE